jgi:hypothetical protein
MEALCTTYSADGQCQAVFKPRFTLVRLGSERIGAEPDFRWRGYEVSRIEGLSDGVFAIAVTLLIVWLEVPKTFAELMAVQE